MPSMYPPSEDVTTPGVGGVLRVCCCGYMEGTPEFERECVKNCRRHHILVCVVQGKGEPDVD